MQSRFHSRDFGVLEIIVSVAILAAFSVFVLQLFVAASKDRQKMTALDSANYAAVSYIEQFRAGSTPFALCSKLGGAPSGGSYDGTVEVPTAAGLSAHLTIAKTAANTGGSIYTLKVELKRSSDGAPVFSLSDAKFFSNHETGDAGG
ncbi:MAG: hypothetical protein P4L75_01310 [Clostridia bacterium]|nr:hypothetical protein [Clostridia bacterium]MDR3645515.1 hypothetical protein [Clostridia bacterium]